MFAQLTERPGSVLPISAANDTHCSELLARCCANTLGSLPTVTVTAGTDAVSTENDPVVCYVRALVAVLRRGCSTVEVTTK